MPRRAVPVDPVDPVDPPHSGASSGSLARVLARVADGDRGALGPLYDLTAGPAHRLATVLAEGDRAAAADILCAAYLDAWCTAHHWEPAVVSPLGWMLCLVRDAGARHPGRAA